MNKKNKVDCRVSSFVFAVYMFYLGACASGKRLYDRTTYSADVRADRKKIYGGGQWQTDGL